MKMAGIAIPFTTYDVPPGAPEAVQAAWLDFVRIGAAFDDLRSDLKDARANLVQAQAQDVRAIAATATAGEELPDPRQHERQSRH